MSRLNNVNVNNRSFTILNKVIILIIIDNTRFLKNIKNKTLANKKKL